MKFSRQKWKSREVALLVLPALALVAFGFVMQREPRLVGRSETGNFSLTIDEIKQEPATPLEVFKGYDTRVTVKYTMSKAPQIANAKLVGSSAFGNLNARLIQRKDGAERVLRLPGVSAVLLSGLEDTTFLFRLSKVPLSDGELTFKTSVCGGYVYNKSSGGIKSLYTTPVPVEIVVRKAGETVQIPVVSKYCPLKQEEMKVEAVASAQSVVGENTRVTATVRCLEEPPIEGFKDKCVFSKPRLVDANGKEYMSFNNKMIGKNMAQIVIGWPGDGGNEKTCHRWFGLPVQLIPKSGGRVTFKTEVSINDGWPLPLSVVVRER